MLVVDNLDLHVAVAVGPLVDNDGAATAGRGLEVRAGVGRRGSSDGSGPGLRRRARRGRVVNQHDALVALALAAVQVENLLAIDVDTRGALLLARRAAV